MRRIPAAALAVALLAGACSAGAAGGTPAEDAEASASPPAPPPYLPGVAAAAEPGPVLLPAEGERYTNPGAIVAVDATLHAFRNSFSGVGADTVTHHLVSEDEGATWTPSPDAPVLTDGDVPYVELGSVHVRAVVPDGDGGWLAYFYTVGAAADPGFIGLARAAALEGPWTVDPDPVLEPGPSGSWDDRVVGEPAVLRRDDGYHLWFLGKGRDGTDAIGYATSPDGVTWTKHDDPATADERLAASDPVLVGEGGWNDGDIGDPSVLETDDGLLLFYDNADTKPAAIGLATSHDGTTWTHHPANPVVTSTELEQPKLFQFEAVAVDGGVRLFVEGGWYEGGTAIFPVLLRLDP